MKKILFFCLILLCVLSVFAADISCKVMVVASYGEKGFSLISNDGIWNPVIAMSVNGDYAGASFSWCPVNFSYSDFKYQVWFKPEEGSPWKFTFGSNIATGFAEKIAFENLSVYGVVYYSDYDPECISEDKHYINATVGFGFMPYEYRDFLNATVFVSSCFNLVNAKTGTFHIDNLTKLNIDENKPSLNYSLTETTYGLALEDWTPFYNKGAIIGPFDFDESYYFTNWSSSWAKHETIIGITPSFGLRYKYYNEADMQNETGFYGYAVVSNNFEGTGVEGELEIGQYNSEFIGKIIGSKDALSYKTLVGFEVDWSEGFNLKPELYSKINYQYEGYNLYLVSNYNNAYNIFGSADGVFFNPGVAFNVDACGLDFGAIVGFDSLKKFRWNTKSKLELNFGTW